MDQALLRTHWEGLMDGLSVPPSQSKPVFANLCERYSAPNRFYHTLTHVARMLETIDRLRHTVSADTLPALHFAVWFHDAVYETRTNDSEEQSAQFARRSLVEWALSGELVESVERLILATRTHELDISDAAGALFLDADLEILGGKPLEYDRYCDAIRQEFAWVPDESYRAGRSRVLGHFLARPQIYRTETL